MQESQIIRQKTLSRRRFAGTLATTFAVTTFAGGGRAVAQESTPVPALSESPIFAEQVAAGTLPPVEERLPKNPLVVQPHTEIGTYGGTWRTATVGGSDNAWGLRTIGYEYLVRWDPEWTEVIPNLAASFEASADATRYTFTLREGLRWSDGEPFTTADIEFYINDIYSDPEIGTGLGSNPRTIEVQDELTFTIVLERPDGLFLFNMASPDGRPYTLYPKHYLSQFMKKYNTTNLDQLVEEAGVADWIELFRTKGGTIPGTPYDASWQNTELPNLLAYTLVEPADGGTRMLVQRNPYYWKIDPEGNQLPYIDAVDYANLQDAEVLLLKALNGELDVHYRHIVTTINKPVLADGREEGNYQLYDTIRGDMNDVMVALNRTHKDPLTREILDNHDFRVALSHAINRQEIIDTVYTSQGEPWQGAPLPDTTFFNETLAKQYTEYDPDLAIEMLDQILPEKDSDGWRLRSDGSPLVILIDVASGGVFAPVDQINLVAGYWQAVGVQAQVNAIDRSLLYSRKAANDHDAAVWYGNAGSQFGAYIDPRWYFPFTSESLYAVTWAYWYQELTESQAPPEEPPEAVKQQIELYKQLQGTPDTEEQSRLFSELLAIAQEQFHAIGIVKPGPGYGIVHNRMVNVPNPMPEEYIWPTPAPSNPEQYFIREPPA